MMPARPPPPTAWNRPFQLAPSGSQTSKLIAGSTVPATRHIAGTLIGCAPGPCCGAPGGLKSPAGTRSASVIFVCGSASFARSAHAVAACAGAAINSGIATAAEQAAVESSGNERFIVIPPGIGAAPYVGKKHRWFAAPLSRVLPRQGSQADAALPWPALHREGGSYVDRVETGSRVRRRCRSVPGGRLDERRARRFDSARQTRGRRDVVRAARAHRPRAAQ